MELVIAIVIGFIGFLLLKPVDRAGHIVGKEIQRQETATGLGPGFGCLMLILIAIGLFALYGGLSIAVLDWAY